MCETHRQSHLSSAHPFESAGLGKAPFRYVGGEVRVYQAYPGAPVQPGSSCDYCGTGIMNVCWVASADGKRFKVGIDCIRKLGRDDNRLIQDAEKDERARKRKLAAARTAVRRERDLARVQAAFALLDAVPGLPELLASRPHPYAARGEFFAKQTLLDQIRWNRERAGLAGCLESARKIEEAAAEIRGEKNS